MIPNFFANYFLMSNSYTNHFHKILVYYRNDNFSNRLSKISISKIVSCKLPSSESFWMSFIGAITSIVGGYGAVTFERIVFLDAEAKIARV